MRLEAPLVVASPGRWPCAPAAAEASPVRIAPLPPAPGSRVARSSWPTWSAALGAAAAIRGDAAVRRRRGGRRGGSVVSLRASEGVEMSDALGKELTGRALCVGYDPGPDRNPGEAPWSPEESLDELAVLCQALDVQVKEKVLQKWRPDRGTLPIGKGKIAELREQVRTDPEIGVVIFDKDLTYRALMTLKGRIDPSGEVVIMDRTSLILRIFAARARTAEAKLQVTLASQQYMLPRLRYYLTTGGGMEARGGSVGAMGGGSGGALRGAGETQLSKDKSMFVRQMSQTRKALDEVRKNRRQLRQKAQNLGIPVVSLVGYTNTGKSSLLNRLCGTTEVVAKDQLFETLDPTRRRVKLDTGRECMLVDTVGFIQRLPSQLVAGFNATLEEVAEADVVLHVIDASSPTADLQIATVEATLKDLKEYDNTTPQLLVLNKVDKLEGREDGLPTELQQSVDFAWPGAVGVCQISALTGEGISGLAQAIEATLLEHTSWGAARMKLLIPYNESSDYAKLRGPPPMAKINSEEFLAEGYLLEVVASVDAARQLKKYEVA